MFLLIIAFLSILAINLPQLIRAKSKRDLTTYCTLFLFVFVIAMLQTLGFTVPSPLLILDAALTSIGIRY